MNNRVLLVVGVLLIIGVGGIAYWQTRATPASNTNTMQTTGGEGSNTDGGERITASEVASHADGASCWSIINGSVYDLTSWIPQHPGGSQAILQLCGKDGSAKFNAQHGGASMQLQILAGFKIGVAQ